MTKKDRLRAIQAIVADHQVENQEELQYLLKELGFDVTQATLSRDIKALKISKSPNQQGKYVYTMPNTVSEVVRNTVPTHSLSAIGFVSLEFSSALGVIRTRPGYAMGIASDIDNRAGQAILATIAGDDTILVIPREGVSREAVIHSLSIVIPI